MRRFPVTLTVVLSLLCAPEATADAESRLLRKVTIDDGLSQNSIYCLYQDSRGFLWFGTGDGLNRYDGYTITVYRHDPDDSASIPNNAIRAIAEANNGTLFVATDRGVVRYDRGHGRFESVWPQPSNKLKVSSSGVLWMGTAGSGLVAMDLSTGRYRQFDADRKDHHSIGGNTIRGLTEAADGTLWIATERALHWIHAGEDSVGWVMGSPFPATALANVCEMTMARDGRLWLGTLGGGLLWYAPGTGESGRFRARPRDPHALPSDSVFSVGTDAAGNVWVGTTGGPALCTDLDKGRFIALPGSYGTGVRVALDRSGLIWVGTDGFGVEVHTLRPERFQLLRANPGDPNSLSGDFIRSIYEDTHGTVWIGTFQRGLTLWDGRQNSFRQLNSKNTGLRGTDVYAVLEDAEGTVWVGTDEGLNEYRRRTGKFLFHPSHSALARVNANERQTQVNGITLDDEDRLWVATNSGLEIFDHHTGRFLRGTGRWSFLHQIPQIHITSVYLDGDSLAWLGTRYSGLIRIDRGSGTVSTFQHEPLDSASLNSQAVRSVYRDSRKRLWIATDHGLAMMTKQVGSFVRILERDGLPSASLYGILEDRAGNLWISSNNGLTRFTPETMSFRSYGRQDGLQSHEFNAGAFFKNKAGEMFFGGVYGLNHFHPDSMQDNPTLPSVVLTGFKKFDMPARLEIEPDEIREIVLQADEAVFSLLYAGLEFTNPAGNQYAYRLEGFEDSWIRAGSRREVRYTSLPPGDYTFRVKASNSDGVWNNNGLAVHIVIVPPFWHSWWFLSLGGVTVLGGVVGTIRFLELRRIRQKITRLEKEEAVQRERIRISRDMHDELGASLTRIGLLAGIAGSPGRKVEEIRGHLQKIEETSRDVVQRLDEVVWMVNPKNDTVESLAAYVAEYAEHFFIESPIRCRFDYPTTVPALPVAAEVRRNVFLAIKEALNNIMKHSAAQVATLELHLDGGKVQFVVRDDGKGFTLPAGGSLGNGVGNMRSRIEEVRGEYILTSAPGRGTSIVISLQLPTP